MNLNEWSKDCHENALAHDWWSGEKRTFGELIALCHSELSEALEDYRNGHTPTEEYYPHSHCSATKEYICQQSCDDCKCMALGKPCGIPSELADVLIRVFDMCGYYGIDLEKAVQTKHEYNKSRPMRHGGKVI